jgi:malto-oligosyltrehalose trehalohydrolase
MVIYEIHLGTFDAVIPRLEALRDLGITAIELMPVASFPGAHNWGYDGVGLFAPQRTYGGPAGLQGLVNACHAHGVAVILDVVYNHLGPEGNYLAEFGPCFTDRYKTPWGPAMNFDGEGSRGVRDFVIGNALYWVREYHILCCGLEDCAVRLEIPPGSWCRLLDSADERFGGSGAQSPRLLRAGSDGRADFAARARGATLYLRESTE